MSKLLVFLPTEAAHLILGVAYSTAMIAKIVKGSEGLYDQSKSIASALLFVFPNYQGFLTCIWFACW